METITKFRIICDKCGRVEITGARYFYKNEIPDPEFCDHCQGYTAKIASSTSWVGDYEPSVSYFESIGGFNVPA